MGSTRHYKSGRNISGRAARIEGLEHRQLLSASVSNLTADSLLTLSPLAGTSTSIQGYSPSQIKTAYGFNSITLTGGVKADGSGQTIAIVDAYNDPNIAADLKVFDKQFSLSDPTLTVVSQTGSTTSLPKTDAGWSQEISLDVEWAHAIAPGAKILLVEAKSDSLSDLLTAINYARNYTSVSVVSLSWGSSEFYGQSSYDSYFSTPAGHQGVTFVASSGDDGSWYGPSWPATSSNVLAVGGTSLYTSDSTGTYAAETGWSYSGGGVSRYTSEPSYQTIAEGTGRRTSPDVSYDADPNTGFAVYTSVTYQGYKGWLEYGGTSAGAPQWAALVAIADQARVAAGKTTLDGASQTLPTLYSLYTAANYYTDYNDITIGSSSYFMSAYAGYDGVTGLGSPKAARVVAALVSGGTTTTTVATVTTTRTASARTHRAISQPVGLTTAAAVTMQTDPVAAISTASSTAKLDHLAAMVHRSESSSAPLYRYGVGSDGTLLTAPNGAMEAVISSESNRSSASRGALLTLYTAELASASGSSSTVQPSIALSLDAPQALAQAEAHSVFTGATHLAHAAMALLPSVNVASAAAAGSRRFGHQAAWIAAGATAIVVGAWAAHSQRKLEEERKAGAIAGNPFYFGREIE